MPSQKISFEELLKCPFYRLEKGILSKLIKFTCPLDKLTGYIYSEQPYELQDRFGHETYLLENNKTLLGYITFGDKIYQTSKKAYVAIDIARIATNSEYIGLDIATFLIAKIWVFAFMHNKMHGMSKITADAFIKPYEYRGITLCSKKFFENIGFDIANGVIDVDRRYPDEKTQTLILPIENDETKVFKMGKKIIRGY